MTDQPTIQDDASMCTRLADEINELHYVLLSNPNAEADELLAELFCEWFDLSEEDIDYIKGLQS